MPEQDKERSEKDILLERYRQLGRISQLVDNPGLSDAIKELIKRDPEKLDAFLDGAQAGQRERMDREDLTSEE